MWQIIQAIIVYGWMGAALLFLYLIWKRSAQRAQQKDQALIDAAIMSANAAHEASEAACLLACKIKVVEEKQL